MDQIGVYGKIRPAYDANMVFFKNIVSSNLEMIIQSLLMSQGELPERTLIVPRVHVA